MLMKPTKLGQCAPSLRILRLIFGYLFQDRKGFIEFFLIAKIKCMLQFVLHQSFIFISD